MKLTCKRSLKLKGEYATEMTQSMKRIFQPASCSRSVSMSLVQTLAVALTVLIPVQSYNVVIAGGGRAQ
jgi:hypothetical protein